MIYLWVCRIVCSWVLWGCYVCCFCFDFCLVFVDSVVIMQLFSVGFVLV